MTCLVHVMVSSIRFWLLLRISSNVGRLAMNALRRSFSI